MHRLGIVSLGLGLSFFLRLVVTLLLASLFSFGCSFCFSLGFGRCLSSFFSLVLLILLHVSLVLLKNGDCLCGTRRSLFCMGHCLLLSFQNVTFDHRVVNSLFGRLSGVCRLLFICIHSESFWLSRFGLWHFNFWLFVVNLLF